MEITRREMIVGSTLAVIGLSNLLNAEVARAETTEAGRKYQNVFEQLDRFIAQYMQDMNAPGMTVAIADRSGMLRASVYGFSDLEQTLPVRADQLFQIGSITKSFVALICLQLAEEGKLDLQAPVLEYAPWLRMQSPYTVKIHHLLTHSSGLPGNAPLFLTDPAAKHEVRFVPGEAFHYCNMGYVILGEIISALDGMQWNESVKKRIFEPLNMTSSDTRIASSTRAATAKSYVPLYDDRPYPRTGPLTVAPCITFTEASGSIVSTASDMAKYMAMILNGGAGPKSRIISEKSFAEYSKAQIKAEEFGPTASYGYGLAVDDMDGHKILRHTGGMVSFMSAIHMDLDEGVGIFASINAQQGYRPNPVCAHGLKLLRAANAAKELPAMPAKDDFQKIEKASDYAGTYEASDGSQLVFSATADELFLLHGGKKLRVENSSGGMIVRHPEFEIFPFVFGRKDEKSPVTDVGHGERFYMGRHYDGPRTFDYPKEWNAFTGYYRNDSPWVLGFRVLMRQGKLWIDGVEALEAMQDGRFRGTSEPKSPEWISFHDPANGQTQRLQYSGENYWRVSLEA